MTTTYAERVDAGMAFMNEQMPGWMDEINLSTLSLLDTDECIFGQVFRAIATEGDCCGWHYGLNELLDGDLVRANALGFTEMEDPHFDDLTAMWRAKIAAARV